MTPLIPYIRSCDMARRVAAIASAVLNTQRTAEAKKAKKPRKEGKSK